MRRRLRTNPFRYGTSGDWSIIFFGEHPNALDRSIARDDQHRIVRRIVLTIERQRVFGRELPDLAHPADDGAAIGVVEI